MPVRTGAYVIQDANVDCIRGRTKVILYCYLDAARYNDWCDIWLVLLFLNMTIVVYVTHRSLVYLIHAVMPGLAYVYLIADSNEHYLFGFLRHCFLHWIIQNIKRCF